MYEHAGPDEMGVKLRGANWLSGEIEQHPARKWREKHRVILTITHTFYRHSHNTRDSSDLFFSDL